MADPLPVPEQAVTAAAGAMWDAWIHRDLPIDGAQRCNFFAREALEAAQPHILAAAVERLKAATVDEYTAICAETVLEAVGPYEDLLASIWLYIEWRYVTTQLTTEQKELFADSVDRSHERTHDGTDEPSKAERWWRQ